MLKTALKPRWILMLILAMSIAAVFVLLSQWQFSSSRDVPPPAPSTTENVRPLTDVLMPLTPLPGTSADQMVSLDGEFLPGTRILVENRLLDGEEGVWVVQAFAVRNSVAGTASDAAGEAVIPVVLGWSPDAAQAAPVAEQEGQASVVGRLLPPEAPEPQRPVAGQVPTLSTAELSNLWDRTSYAAFVVATDVTVEGAEAAFASDLEQVVVGPQPQETPLNWLNIFYAIEWVVFAGFAFFLWWRLVADDHRRSLEDAADAAEEARAHEHRGDPVVVVPSVTASSSTSDTSSDIASDATTDATSDPESGAHRD